MEQITIDEFDRSVAVNVAPCSSPRRKRRGTCPTADASSPSAARMPTDAVRGWQCYGMTKAAVAGLTRGLARDLGPATSPSTRFNLARGN